MEGREAGMEGWRKELRGKRKRREGREEESEARTEGQWLGRVGGTEGGMDKRMIETQNKQLLPDRIKLFFH